MIAVDLIPFGAEAQRIVERHWLAAVRDHTLAGGVRAVVRSPWDRSYGAAVALKPKRVAAGGNTTASVRRRREPGH